MNKDIDELLDMMEIDEMHIETKELSQNEIDKIHSMTMDKINKEKAADINFNKAGSTHFTKNTIRKMWITIIAATLITGTVAYGAIHWNDKFSRFFNLNGKEDTTQVAAMDVDKSAAVNGVTVTAKQVVGDGQGLYLLLQIKDSDKAGTNFEKVDVNIDGVSSFQNSDLMCMGVDEKIASYILSISSNEKLLGKNISLTLKNYGYNQDDKFVTTNQGTWKLSWKLDYEVKTTEYKVNKNINIYGGTAKFDSIALSPLSVTVNLSDLKNIRETMADGSDPNDRLIVNFIDGSAVNSDYSDNVLSDTDKKTIYFHKVASPEKIESISFAGLTVPITKNPNPIQYVHHDFKDMGFAVDMQKDLDNITTTTKEEYYDNIVNAKGIKMSFTGKIDGVKMNMFDIIMFKTDISKDVLYKKNCMLTYLGYTNGYVYAISYGEPETDEQMSKFKDIENRDIANILPRITVYEIQNSKN